jgi:hypothetical protein
MVELSQFSNEILPSKINVEFGWLEVNYGILY